MSYARFGWDGSDVYVFLGLGGMECAWCRLGEESTYGSADAMLAHLREHIAAGHTVPSATLARIEAERDEIDSFIASDVA